MPKRKTIETVTDASGKSVPIYRYEQETAFFFKSCMTVDADGSPFAYHPDDYPVDHKKGLDNPAHAGHPGDWWALATDNGKSSGKPLVQKSGPAKGYWISMTALSSGPEESQSSYVDAEKIPYVVLPSGLASARRGDFAVVVHLRTKLGCYAIFADTNPNVGEGSIACAGLLNLDRNARTGGTTKQDIGYLIFPKSGNGKPRTLEDIQTNGAKLADAWGGFARLIKELA
jgi:hypothetical protein